LVDTVTRPTDGGGGQGRGREEGEDDEVWAFSRRGVVGRGGGEDDDTWAFSRPGDGEREGRNVVGIARSKEEKRLVCTTFDLVRSGRNPVGSRLKIGGPPKTRTRVIEIGVCGVTESIAPSFLSCVWCSSSICWFLSPLQKGLPLLLICIYNRLFSCNLKLLFLHELPSQNFVHQRCGAALL